MSARHQHEMPFGAQILPDGRVRFGLWAPAAGSVDLVLEESGALLRMEACEDGWYRLVTASARAGSRYRFRIDGARSVPDPAARANDGVHGASIVVDPRAYAWQASAWRGLPWERAVLYELHVGTFTREGTFRALHSKLDHLVQLGVTVIELMPLAQFPGARGWGYDGVLPFAPQSTYGTPEELKALIDAIHQRGLAVILDVVYNHFGPEGNWLHLYAPQFFNARHRTPWGAAINFDGERCGQVREFFIHNALYWLEEYQFDGLRVDAVHAMRDDSDPQFVAQLVSRVRESVPSERHVHIVLENHRNEARRLGPPGTQDRAEAQWNEDLHHCLHVILTGEHDGYYVDYAQRPHALLARALAEGFSYQGEPSVYDGGRPRGEISAQLPPTAFVSFLQNHDQVGNRARGERLSTLVSNDAALHAATALILLAPSPPLLFMGEEWSASEPFPYFCDVEPGLADKVRDGRRREFERFGHFAIDPPDPMAASTFASAQLDWSHVRVRPHATRLQYCRRLLAVRAREIVPLLPQLSSGRCVASSGDGAFAVEWRLPEPAVLRVLVNLSARAAPLCGRAAGRVLFATHPNVRKTLTRRELEPWSVIWLRERAGENAIDPG